MIEINKEIVEISVSIATIVSSIGVVIALKQTKIQNERMRSGVLVDRKIKVLLTTIGIYDLVNKESFKKHINSNEPFHGLDMQFLFLTNNKFMESIQTIVGDPFAKKDVNIQYDFLSKMSELENLAIEIELLFSNGPNKEIGDLLSVFIKSYYKHLISFRSYMIIYEMIKEDSNNSGNKFFEDHSKARDEPRYRQEYVDTHNNLVECLDILNSKDVIDKAKKDIHKSME